MKTTSSLLVSFIFSISLVAAQDYSFKESYTVSQPAQLTVSSFDGNLDVKATDGNTIEVFYIARKNGRVLNISKQELEDEVILEVIAEKNSLRISVKNKFQNRSFFNSMDQVHVSFRITVPKQTACDLHTSDGNVSLEGLKSDQRLKTSDGNIQIAAITGSITGATSDGNIRIKDVTGSVDIQTSDGNIVLENIIGHVQSSTSDGNIELTRIKGNISSKTSDGDIHITDIAGSFKGITSDGNVRGNMLELKEELVVHTGDGNIHITIPDRLGLDLEIRGESLNVPLSNFSGKSDKKFIQGKSNGGGIPVKLATSDGNISLTYL